VAKNLVLDATHEVAKRELAAIAAGIDFGSSSESRRLYDEVATAIGRVGMKITQAQAAGYDYAADLRIYPAGRRKQIKDLVAKTDPAVRAEVERLRELVPSLKHALVAEVLPATPQGSDAGVEIQRVSALFQAAKPKDREGLFQKLAARGDATSGLLMSSFGKDLAEVSFGERLGEGQWELVRTQFIHDRADQGNKVAIAARDVTSRLSGIGGGLAQAWENAKTDLSSVPTPETA
jgi:hypothetical protein